MDPSGARGDVAEIAGRLRGLERVAGPAIEDITCEVFGGMYGRAAGP